MKTERLKLDIELPIPEDMDELVEATNKLAGELLRNIVVEINKKFDAAGCHYEGARAFVLNTHIIYLAHIITASIVDMEGGEFDPERAYKIGHQICDELIKFSQDALTRHAECGKLVLLDTSTLAKEKKEREKKEREEEENKGGWKGKKRF